MISCGSVGGAGVGLVGPGDGPAKEGERDVEGSGEPPVNAVGAIGPDAPDGSRILGGALDGATAGGVTGCGAEATRPAPASGCAPPPPAGPLARVISTARSAPSRATAN